MASSPPPSSSSSSPQPAANTIETIATASSQANRTGLLNSALIAPPLPLSCSAMATVCSGNHPTTTSVPCRSSSSCDDDSRFCRTTCRVPPGLELDEVARDHPRVGDVDDPPALGVQPARRARRSSIRTFSGRTVKRLPSRSSRFEVPTKPATNGLPGLLVDLRRRPDLLDPPVVEDRDPVRHRQRLLLVVRDVDEGDPHVRLDRLQLHLHLLAELQVERAERLVQEQHPRAG